jgi:hypothetical protein
MCVVYLCCAAAESNIDGMEIGVSNDERRDRAVAENSEDKPTHRSVGRGSEKVAAHITEADTFSEEEGEEESRLQSAEDSDTGCQICRERKGRQLVPGVFAS